MLATESDWAAAYERHADDVYRLARVIVRHPDDAGEVVQATFEKAFRHRVRYDQTRPLRHGLLGIAAHEALQLARRRRLRAWLPLAASQASPEMLDPLPVWQAVDRLPPGHRACVGLFYLHGFTIDEVGSILGIPPGTVASRLHHARKPLKAPLSETPSEA